MKTTEEVLNEIGIQNEYNDWSDLTGQCDNHLSYITQAMIAYAQQAIEEDRKMVAENVCIEKRTFVEGSEEFSSTLDVEFDTRHHRFLIDTSSIINAPKQELK